MFFPPWRVFGSCPWQLVCGHHLRYRLSCRHPMWEEGCGRRLHLKLVATEQCPQNLGCRLVSVPSLHATTGSGKDLHPLILTLPPARLPRASRQPYISVVSSLTNCLSNSLPFPPAQEGWSTTDCNSTQCPETVLMRKDYFAATFENGKPQISRKKKKNTIIVKNCILSLEGLLRVIFMVKCTNRQGMCTNQGQHISSGHQFAFGLGTSPACKAASRWRYGLQQRCTLASYQHKRRKPGGCRSSQSH